MSYISIDRTNMRFLHKNEDYGIVSDVSWIEAPHVSLIVTKVDHTPFLAMLTDYEARLLYRNTTGEATSFTGNALRSILQELASRLPNTDADKGEAYLQAEALPMDNKAPHLYVKGADKPALRETVFQDGLKAPAAQDEGPIAARAALQSAKPPAPSPAAPKARPAPARSPAGVPTGGLRALIWAKADTMWAAAGSPLEKSTVLRLRKDIMDALGEDGVNRNTASIELGNWQKNRLQA